MGVLKEERDDVEMVANLSLFLYSMTYLISLRYLKLLSGYLEGKLILKLFVVCWFTKSNPLLLLIYASNIIIVFCHL